MLRGLSRYVFTVAVCAGALTYVAVELAVRLVS